jgi:PAS domain S-box-containing protein
MLNWLKGILRPPVFEDEQKAHQAYLLNIIIWALILVPLPYVPSVMILYPEEAPRALIQGGTSEAINFFLLFLLHRGHVRMASILQVTFFWIFFTLSAVTGVGVQGEAYLLGYPLVIVIAGVLLGGREALIVTIVSLAAGLFMANAQQVGLIKDEISHPPFLTWVISLVIFPMGALLQQLSSRTVKSALERAHRSEETYRLISKVSSDYTFESRVDEQGNASLVWVGGAFERMTGFTPQEYITRGAWYAHIHPEDLEKDAEDMRNLLNNREVIGSEIRTFARDGTIRWERVFAHPVWDEKKNRLVGIIGAVQDVTEQKKAEALLRETLLRQSAILDNIPDMAWLKDLDSRYIAVNEQFATVSGRRPEEIVGRTDYDIWQRGYAEKYRADDLDVIRRGKRRQVEELQRDSSSREYWVETIKTPIRGEHGEVVGTIGIAREITERKQAEFERERLIAELEAKNAELERFSYTVSHDLKSPLVTIMGFLGFLEKDAASGNIAMVRSSASRIAEAARKMQALLNDLLELSRIGRLMNTPENIPFTEIVNEAVDRVRGQLDEGDVTVEIQRDFPTVRGDRVRLVEVMQNLLDNAAKYAIPGVKSRVEIGTNGFNEKGFPVFFVRDNGVGIEPQHHERIFGLFNKLDVHSEGTGIGLSLVKRIIEVHSGQIWVESAKEKGATFYFSLPTPQSKE